MSLANARISILAFGAHKRNRVLKTLLSSIRLTFVEPKQGDRNEDPIGTQASFACHFD